eukprot:1139574-Pelagomonas_calceolata.AAC.5
MDALTRRCEHAVVKGKLKQYKGNQTAQCANCACAVGFYRNTQSCPGPSSDPSPAMCTDLWWPDAQLGEPVSMLDGQHYCLHQLLDLLVQAPHVCVVLCGLLIHLHGLDPGVILRRQGIQDEVRVLVHAHQVPRLQGVGIHQAHHGQEDGLSGGRLQHNTLALALCIQVHCCTILLLIALGLHVQHLHDIGHQVRELVVHFDLLLVLLDLQPQPALLQAQARGLVLQHAVLVVQEPGALRDRLGGHACRA